MMKKATVEDFELGNLLFGNSRGEYLIEDREEYQEVFCKFLRRNGFDFEGWHDNGEDKYENDTFIIRPYYWGEDEDIADLPNFVYKPTGFEIRWYKYPMRNAFANQDIGLKEFEKIMRDCDKSMRG